MKKVQGFVFRGLHDKILAAFCTQSSIMKHEFNSSNSNRIFTVFWTVLKNFSNRKKIITLNLIEIIRESSLNQIKTALIETITFAINWNLYQLHHNEIKKNRQI